MRNRSYIVSLFFVLISISGCGDVTTIDNGEIYIPRSTPTPIPTATQTVISNMTPPPPPTITPPNINSDEENSSGLRIVGRVTYDRVHVKRSGIGLDYNNITKDSAKYVLVELVKDSCSYSDRSDIIKSTFTDGDGNYEFNDLSPDQSARICVYAKMQKDGVGGWDLEVVDNTNGGALYTMQSSRFYIGTESSKRNLNASSGWDGTAYSGTRTAAPFAIVDSLYKAMDKVLSADSNVTFPPLKVNWSPNNVPAGNGTEEELLRGQIITSHLNGDGNLYILGDENSDTDEYDDHIMLHEWGHYFESKFSRADSIGGPHGDGDRLDIRVAFGEGWGNAWSAIATDNPIYFDTQGIRQSNGFSIDIENDTSGAHGWYSEDSIQRILYDIYDSRNDRDDKLSLGFRPIYKVLVGPQKTTPAFTSIFTFITYLQSENESESSKIDAILADEDISHIYDIYGSRQSNLYTDMEQGNTKEVCMRGEYGVYFPFNKTDYHKYIRFAIDRSSNYKILVKQNNGTQSDPDFGLYKTKPFEHIGDANGYLKGEDSANFTLDNGNYLLDIGQYESEINACFDITIN